MRAPNDSRTTSEEKSMNSFVSHQFRASVAGPLVPITVRTLAANALARGGSIECDMSRVREHAVNWLALAMLLAAWNVEARLEDPMPASPSGDRPLASVERALGGFDWTERKSGRWIASAARHSVPCGAGRVGTRVPANGVVRTVRSR
jgi:hypothetical protein